MREIVYKQITDEGINLHLDLHYPISEAPTAGGAKYPVIIYTHGGGWGKGTRKLHGGMGRVLQMLIEKGYCVASVQYRLRNQDMSSKECEEEIILGDKVLIRDCVIDAKDAVRYLSKHRDELCVDMNRVFIFGDSAGGQIAQMLLLSPPDALPGEETLAGFEYTTIAGVSWDGPSNFLNSRFKGRIVSKGMTKAEQVQAMREVSPINYLTKQSPPLLMFQGDKDTTIPIHHAYQMKEKADEVGAPVEIVIVKNAGHNWRDGDPESKDPIEPSRGEIVQQTVQYFARFLE